MEDHERGDREDEDPEELVAVTGAEDRVRRDPGGVVVGEAREDPGAKHGQKRGQPEPAKRDAEPGPPVPATQPLDERIEHGLDLSRWLVDYGKPAVHAG